MRKIFTTLMAVCLMLASTVATARNVDVNEARQVAANYMGLLVGHDIAVAEMELVYQFDNEELGVPSAYLFNASDEGWLFVSASTVAIPVLGYCVGGHLDVNDLPTNMLWYSGSLAERVARVQVLDRDGDLDEDSAWKVLTSPSKPDGSPATKMKTVWDIEPLLTTLWDQGNSGTPTFNMYCPLLNGQRSIVGCVATALSQIVYYFRYPVCPKGQYSYEWSKGGKTLAIDFDTVRFNFDAMPSVSLSATSSLSQKQAASLLCYAVGMAVRMDYSPSASGTQSSLVAGQMRKYFKYQKGTLMSRAKMGDDAFIDTIRWHICKGYPIYMHGTSPSGGGVDAGGHAWVVDGVGPDRVLVSQGVYDTIEKYHMNWGWGANSNTWYNMKVTTTHMKPLYTDYDFNSDHGVIVNMLPPADSIRVDSSRLAITAVESRSELAPAYPNPATLQVVLPYSTTTAADLVVYSIDGKAVETRRLAAGEGEVTLDVSRMPAGIYVYRMGGATGKFIVR